jgi:hypothetical protein
MKRKAQSRVGFSDGRALRPNRFNNFETKTLLVILGIMATADFQDPVTATNGQVKSALWVSDFHG